jgi:hypothetical protein
MTEDFKEKVLNNSVALFLVLIGIATWFLGGRTSDSKELCVALISSGTTLLVSTGRHDNKRAENVVETAQEVNIEDKQK